jgi:hypothetical protein
MRTSGLPFLVRVAVAVTVGPALLAGLAGCAGGSGGSGGEAGSASCAAVLVHGGHTYLGHGGVRRDPAVTGRSLPAALPGCNDTGGDTDGDTGGWSQDEKDEHVRVEELADVAPATAVLFRGSVYVRDGRDLPGTTRGWFRAPGCGSTGTFALTGDWLGVTGSRRPRFDGDLRPPYRLEVHVTSGPARYVGATITVRATRSTDPALTRSDVRTSLWRGGQVRASVRCTDRRFEALALDAS